MVLDTNLYFYSPYPTTSQTTTVTTTNANVESYTKTKPVSQSDTTINYGPFEDKAPFSEVLFSQNVNMLTVVIISLFSIYQFCQIYISIH